MAIVSLICSLVSTGCAVFSAVFSIYMYHQQHHNDDKRSNRPAMKCAQAVTVVVMTA